MTNFLSKLERMEIASRIARGMTARNGLIPSDAKYIRALDYLSKIEEDYATIKQEHSINNTDVIKCIRFETDTDIQEGF